MSASTEEKYLGNNKEYKMNLILKFQKYIFNSQAIKN